MRIGEIAELTGLSISNIRFYEKKGLIGPDREAESQYRNYTTDDLERINLIVLYRKMDLSVETIGKILSLELSVEDALEQQLLELKNKQQQLQGSIDLCEKMIEDQAYDQMDVNFYMNYVKEKESHGTKYKAINDVLGDFVEDFSNYTSFNRLVGGTSMGWWLFKWPWANRLIMFLWFMLFLALPVIGIADSLLEQDSNPTLSIVFWGLWILLFLFGFIRFIQKRK